MGDLQMNDKSMAAGGAVNDEQGCRVLCAQLGARDHYAIPRALHRRGALTSLVTDFWWPWGGAAELPMLRRITGRSHEALRSAQVISMNASALGHEVLLRAARVPGWEQMIRRNEWFQKQALWRIPWADFSSERFNSGKPVLFAYSYAALKLLQRAKQLGWTTLLGQIDPGPLDSCIAHEKALLWPEFGATWRDPPPSYYDDWRKELALADRVIVNSEWSYQAIRREGVPSDRIAVIPLPYDEPNFSDRSAKNYPEAFSESRPLRALFLGQVNLRKGGAELLSAMEALRSAPIELWLAGSPKLNLPQRFMSYRNLRWLGSVPRNQVGKLYAAADVFVFPTHSDGFGLTQLEAQAWRLPVIASRSCGPVVVDGENGMLLDEVTLGTIRDGLLRCCENPYLLRKWSAGSGVAARFSLEATGQSMVELIRSIS